MKSTIHEIARRVSAALASALGPEGEGADPQVRPSQNPEFGDYQSNCAMALAKKVNAKPREVAERIVNALIEGGISDICEPPEIAGPGFINLRLKPEYVAGQLRSVPAARRTDEVDPGRAGHRAVPSRDRKGAEESRSQEPLPYGRGSVGSPAHLNDCLGIEFPAEQQIVAVDFPSVNLAKEMHVGHLRSAVVGECVCRCLELQGHTVHRINHVGDWGTQFGMLVAHLRETRPDVIDDPEHLHLGDLETFYVEAKQHFDSDADFADRARRAVVDLQAGDRTTYTVWKAFCDESLRHCQELCDRLGLGKLENRGESYYNDRLPGIIEKLEALEMIEISDGAACVFLEGFKTRDGDRLPMIVRKSDGGYNYSTTDLAAFCHRRNELGATRFIYVVGAPQKQHFDMLFAAVRQAGWADDSVQLVHLAFGSILGSDGTPFKTREGGTVKLKDLLDEAVARARRIIEQNEADPEKHRGFSAGQIDDIAETIGIASARYFDLSHSLASDYRFAWDHMLAMDGNTAPYMLYAYARIRSIGREAGVRFEDLPADAPILLEHASEIGLGKALLRLPEAIETTVRDLRPNVLTDYLFELSKAFNLFYDRKRGVRVKDASPDEVRISRLRLCDLAARALKLGLHLLGINTVEQM